MSRRKRWPLYLIAASAAAAIWSGWVGLGELCGFGVVNLLPGIGGGFHVNTAITLPVGVEAYGAFALGAWMAPGTPKPARQFARRSAKGALALGCAGQVIFHLLSAAGADRAPWPVIVGVSCMPIVVLGFAAALAHLLRLPAEAGDTVSLPSFTDAQSAALAALKRTLGAGNGLSDRQLTTRFRLKRSEVTTVRERATADLNGHAPAGELP